MEKSHCFWRTSWQMRPPVLPFFQYSKPAHPRHRFLKLLHRYAGGASNSSHSLSIRIFAPTEELPTNSRRTLSARLSDAWFRMTAASFSIEDVSFMKYTTIPGSDLYVSTLCLGTTLLGSAIPRQSSYGLLDTYYENGGNFLDTAKIYADWLPGERSMSEKTIGAWLRERHYHNQIIVGTKGGHPGIAIPRQTPNDTR